MGVCDIDDIILNIIGAFIGFVLVKVIPLIIKYLFSIRGGTC
ncbi:hypothetical protein [Alkalihalobacillus sp. TS-13]